MIPLRIMLKGFLCYRDEQEVLLDGSSLWMLAGLNGSGKSAVFDAMTFALFGCHRGGSMQLTMGAGPAFTGFPLKMVTAAGAVAIGAVVETGFVNRSPVALTTGQSVFGSGSTALAAPT